MVKWLCRELMLVIDKLCLGDRQQYLRFVEHKVSVNSYSALAVESNQ